MIGKRVRNLGVVLRTVVAVVALFLCWAPPALAKTATESAAFTRYRITSTTGSNVQGITLDRDGNPWFAEQGTNKVGRLDPRKNTITEYTSPTPNSSPAGILVAPDNTIWYSEHSTDKIAHLFATKAAEGEPTFHCLKQESDSARFLV